MKKDSVFVNCPFDDAYRPYKRVILFTLCALGLKPKIATAETSSSVRLEKIIQMMKESRFGFHDLSRVESTEGKYPRFNMPYELGLDMGLQHSGSASYAGKKVFVLEQDPYRHQKTISDLAGIDPKTYSNQESLLEAIRSALFPFLEGSIIQSAILWQGYNEFQQLLQKSLEETGLTREQGITAIEHMSDPEFLHYIQALLPEIHGLR